MSRPLIPGAALKARFLPALLGLLASVALLALTSAGAFASELDLQLPSLDPGQRQLLFYGLGGQFLIGPGSEQWDAAMLVEQSSPAAFIAFASNPEYLAGIGHRTAALEDSRLLPLEEVDWKGQA